MKLAIAHSMQKFILPAVQGLCGIVFVFSFWGYENTRWLSFLTLASFSAVIPFALNALATKFIR